MYSHDGRDFKGQCTVTARSQSAFRFGGQDGKNLSTSVYTGCSLSSASPDGWARCFRSMARLCEPQRIMKQNETKCMIHTGGSSRWIDLRENISTLRGEAVWGRDRFSFGASGPQFTILPWATPSVPSGMRVRHLRVWRTLVVPRTQETSRQFNINRQGLPRFISVWLAPRAQLLQRSMAIMYSASERLG